MTGRVVEGPVTAAGRRLNAAPYAPLSAEAKAWFLADVLAIEAEARAAAVAPLREWLDSKPQYRLDFTPAERAAWQRDFNDRWLQEGPGVAARALLSALSPAQPLVGVEDDGYHDCPGPGCATCAISAPSPVREPEGLDVERLRKALNRQPEETPEPIGRVRRKWWRLGWLSAMAVAREALPKATPERPADEVDG